MKNRVRNLRKNIPDIETLLKDIEKGLTNTLSDINLVEMSGDILDAWEVEFQKIMIYEKHIKQDGIRLNSSQEVSDLMDAINSVYKILKDPEAPPATKAIIEYMYNWTVAVIHLHPDDPYAQELFDRRNETPKDNPVMFNFLDNVLGGIVYDRFYQAEYDEMIAKGIDIDEHEENLTDDERRSHDKEYDKRYDAVCREYGLEGHIRNRPDDYYSLPVKERLGQYPKPAFSFLDKLPEYIKMERAERRKHFEDEAKKWRDNKNEKQD